jgi:hypothetical protein
MYVVICITCMYGICMYGYVSIICMYVWYVCMYVACMYNMYVCMCNNMYGNNMVCMYSIIMKSMYGYVCESMAMAMANNGDNMYVCAWHNMYMAHECGAVA